MHGCIYERFRIEKWEDLLIEVLHHGTKTYSALAGRLLFCFGLRHHFQCLDRALQQWLPHLLVGSDEPAAQFTAWRWNLLLDIKRTAFPLRGVQYVGVLGYIKLINITECTDELPHEALYCNNKLTLHRREAVKHILGALRLLTSFCFAN